MKSKVIIHIAIIAIVIFVAAFFLFQKPSTDSIDEFAGNEPAIPEEAEEFEPTPEPVPEEIPEEPPMEEEVELFEPELTYEEAYNGPLYATSEQIGNYHDKEKYISNLERNGVNYFIGMFTIFGESKESSFLSHANLGYVADFVKMFPGRVIPFYGSGFGGEELENTVKTKNDVWISFYTDVLDTYPTIVEEDFIRGFGEVETQEWSIQHDDPKVMNLVKIADENNKHFMFHPVAGKLEGVKNMIEAYPETVFLIHLFREDLENGEDELIEIMQTHENLFFSIDAVHVTHYDGNDILYSYYDSYGDNAKNKFISTVENNEEDIISDAVNDYSALVEAVPDKVMWGTEAGPDYSFEPEVYDSLVRVSRKFIYQVTDDPEVQKDLAYRNALRVFGTGVFLEDSVNPINTDSWPYCEEEAFDNCDEECGFTEGDFKSEGCVDDCVHELQCKDPED